MAVHSPSRKHDFNSSKSIILYLKTKNSDCTVVQYPNNRFPSVIIIDLLVETGTPSKAKTLFPGYEPHHLPGTATPGAPGSLLGFILADGQRGKKTLLGIPGQWLVADWHIENPQTSPTQNNIARYLKLPNLVESTNSLQSSCTL